MIIGIMGRKRSGKDTAAAALVNHRGFTRTAFADRMKETLLAINPYLLDGQRLHAVVSQHGWEAAKERGDVRRLLQDFGTALRDQIDPHIWITPVENQMKTANFYDRNLVISDVRNENEAQIILDWGFLLHVERPDIDSDDPHPTESNIPVHLADATIVNNRSFAHFNDAVIRWYDSL